jgi:hypothetical protein
MNPRNPIVRPTTARPPTTPPTIAPTSTFPSDRLGCDAVADVLWLSSVSVDSAVVLVLDVLSDVLSETTFCVIPRVLSESSSSPTINDT